jgi:hypothetical protein
MKSRQTYNNDKTLNRFQKIRSLIIKIIEYAISLKIAMSINIILHKRRIIRKLMKMYSFSPIGIAKYAYRHIPVYQMLYDSIFKKRNFSLFFSMNPFRSENRNKINRLPLFTKAIISRSNPEDFLNQKHLFKARKYAETTGSLGRPSSVFYSDFEFKNSYLLLELVPDWMDIKALARKKITSDGKINSRFAVNGITHGYTIAGHIFGQARLPRLNELQRQSAGCSPQ